MANKQISTLSLSFFASVLVRNKDLLKSLEGFSYFTSYSLSLYLSFVWFLINDDRIVHVQQTDDGCTRLDDATFKLLRSLT
jgi:hypothetical protein